MSTPLSPAIILLAHGSPDPDWGKPVQAVLAHMREQAPSSTIEIAFLDHNTPTLEDCVRGLVDAGHGEVIVIAAFLSAGGRHLKQHVPELVAEIAPRIAPASLRLLPGALGDDPRVAQTLAQVALARAASTTP